MFKKIVVRFFCVLMAIVNFLPSRAIGHMAVSPYGLDVPFYKKIIELFLPSKKTEIEKVGSGKFVYVSGYPIGFSIDGDGAVVVEKSAVITKEGHKNPTETVDVQIGDIIKEVNGVKVSSGETISKVINSEENLGKPASLLVERNGQKFLVEVVPEFDVFASSLRLGLWVRDNAIGVGMITYVTESGEFAALGHPITDIDTGAILPVGGGSVYRCSIIGADKGERGNAGELKGLFLKSSNTVGEVTKNNQTGVYGKIETEHMNGFFGERMEIALPEEVEMGPATILTTVDGLSPKSYDIEIVKTKYTAQDGSKCMVIRIVDEELKAKTGGIVQGMSGSPIIQNGKVVGCVTHVFISDPTKGFARNITSMLQN